MTLFYINFGLDYDEYIMEENELRYGFQLHTRFISNYLSKEIRKIRFKTDGSFNMLSISLTESSINPCRIVPFAVLDVQLQFDRTKYFKIIGTNDSNYYLDLIEKGVETAHDFKTIPYKELIQIVKKFRDGNCKNEWLELKKKFKEDDLEIILYSEFTTNYYQIRIIINQISAKREIINEVIIRTEPYEVVFENLVKTIEIENTIIIKDKFNEPIIEINKEDIFKGKLSYKILKKEKENNKLNYLM
jgi:hypothetical protein